MGVKEKPDVIDIIERKRLQLYGHVKRMQDERLPKLIMEWIPGERRKRGRPRKTWMESVRAAMKTRHLETDQWLNRKEWCLGSRRRRLLSQDRKDRNSSISFPKFGILEWLAAFSLVVLFYFRVSLFSCFIARGSRNRNTEEVQIAWTLNIMLVKDITCYL